MLCSFVALFLRYFSLFDMQIKIVMSHVHNDLSEKVIYLCYYQTKLIQRNHERVFLPQQQTCRFSSDFVCQWRTKANKL